MKHRGRGAGRTALLVLGALLLLLSFWTAAASAAPSPGGPIVGSLLAAPSSGAAAVDALGARLADIARAYDLTRGELVRRLLSDAHLTLDQQGRLFYRDARPMAQAPADPAEGAPAALPAPLSDTFRLHSLPGANRVIYLDFDGHVMSRNAWTAVYNRGNTINAPPFDMDGVPSSFSAAELTLIQRVWQRVAEDYAPFQVDVTTEYPGESALTRSTSADGMYGTRVLISPISSLIGNYGGIAYVGVYDAIGDYYKPALVFPEKLGKNEKYIAEACSHECGHNLNLYHDGTTVGVQYYQGHGSGLTGWAPIMGTGYYQNLTQWSKGEYAKANNTENDLAVILGAGLSYRADDHGDWPAQATVLSGSEPTAYGLIGTIGDKDVFSLTCGAGELTVSAAPAALGPNLDILLTLTDAAGSVLATGNPADDLSAAISLSVAAGTYYVAVTGTGKGDPATGYSNYGSLGVYSLSAQLTPPGNQGLAPVASFMATPTSGNAPLTVTLDASASYDSDGSIESYAWDFGDGSTADGVTTSHVYAAGSYVARLTVTDDDGMSDTESVTITVAGPTNAAPTANVAATPTSGTVPLTVHFDGSGSSDSDGSIATHAWTFGDGSTGSGAVIDHVYKTAGNFTGTLTVTDDKGKVASKSVTIAVKAGSSPMIRLESMTLTAPRVQNNYQGKATVKVTDAAGVGVRGVTVRVTWSGTVTGASSGVTDSSGVVTLSSTKFTKTGTLTCSISKLSMARWTYVPELNLVNWASIQVGP